MSIKCYFTVIKIFKNNCFSTGAQCNGVFDDKCKKIVLDTSTQNVGFKQLKNLQNLIRNKLKDNGSLFIYNQDYSQDQNAEKIYQKFTNVCRRGSISKTIFYYCF